MARPGNRRPFRVGQFLVAPVLAIGLLAWGLLGCGGSIADTSSSVVVASTTTAPTSTTTVSPSTTTTQQPTTTSSIGSTTTSGPPSSDQAQQLLEADLLKYLVTVGVQDISGKNIVIGASNGVASSSDGLILTANVVMADGEPASILTVLPAVLPSILNVTFVGYDKATGVALLKVEDGGVETPTFSSAPLHKGDWVLGFQSSDNGFDGVRGTIVDTNLTMTFGSNPPAKGVFEVNFASQLAAGSPLFNAKGEVVGMVIGAEGDKGPLIAVTAKGLLAIADRLAVR